MDKVFREKKQRKIKKNIRGKLLQRGAGNVSPTKFSTFDFFPISENGISSSLRRAVVQHVLSYNSLGTKFKKNWCSLNCVSNLARGARCRQDQVEKSMDGRIKCGTSRSFK